MAEAKKNGWTVISMKMIGKRFFLLKANECLRSEEALYAYCPKVL